MSSLSRAYEIFPRPAGRRRRGDLGWMRGAVEVRVPDLERPQRFASIPQLWATYIEGCLAGPPSRVAVVRHEDVLMRPGAVVRALEDLGLPRNRRKFAIIHVQVRVPSAIGGAPALGARDVLVARGAPYQAYLLASDSYLGAKLPRRQWFEGISISAPSKS